MVGRVECPVETGAKRRKPRKRARVWRVMTRSEKEELEKTEPAPILQRFTHFRGNHEATVYLVCCRDMSPCAKKEYPCKKLLPEALRGGLSHNMERENTGERTAPKTLGLEKRRGFGADRQALELVGRGNRANAWQEDQWKW